MKIKGVHVVAIGAVVVLLVVVPAVLASLQVIPWELGLEGGKILSTLVAPLLALILGYYFANQGALVGQETLQRVREIEERAEREPDKARYAWDLARVKLEAYFDRNLSQVNMIFWISVAVMLVGFGFIIVSLSLAQPGNSQRTNVVGVVAGIITEFIGATFMFIYRSTMEQARSFMVTLDRINSVGMAVQILDTIPEQSSELKSKTKAEIVKVLLEGSRGRAEASPNSP